MSTVNHTSDGPIRMAEVLAAFPFATDLGTGKSMGHALRACFLGMAMARELRLSTSEQAELYYSFLLMHSGCAASSLALLQGDAGEDIRGVCEVAVRVAQRLNMPQGVQNAVRHYLERWDGIGPFGLRETKIPLNARLLHLALRIEACNSVYGRETAVNMALEQKGKIYDPQVVEVFLSIAGKADLWETLAKQELRERVLDLEPDSPYRYIGEAKLDDIALAAADFVD